MGGANWTEVLNAKTFLNTSEKVYMSHLNIDSSNSDVIYVLASIEYYFHGILLKSTDGGSIWSKFDSNADGKLACLAIDPNDSQMLYAGTWYNGMYRSRDGGKIWEPINNGLPTTWAPFYSVAVDPTDTQHIYTGLGNRVYHSTDAGDSWSQIGNSLTANEEDDVQNITIDSAHPNNVFASVASLHGYTYIYQTYKLVGWDPHISAPSRVASLVEPGEPDVITRTISVHNTGTGILNWSVSDATKSWLTSQKVGDEIHLTFDKSEITLVDGRFCGTDTLTIIDSKADNSPYLVTVTFYVGPVSCVYLPTVEK